MASGNARCPHPRQHQSLREATLGHARDVPYPEQRAARKVVFEFEHARALLEALGGDPVDVGLAHGDTAHLANPLVVPTAEPINGGLCEAPRLAAIQQDREHTARI